MKNKQWVEDTDENDWRFYTSTHTAVVWYRPDGWWVSIGFNKTQKTVEDRGGFQSLDAAKSHAEEFIRITKCLE